MFEGIIQDKFSDWGCNLERRLIEALPVAMAEHSIQGRSDLIGQAVDTQELLRHEMELFKEDCGMVYEEMIMNGLL